jgi:hypothetical protein
MTIRRIDPGSLSKVLGVLYAILGLIGGVVLALMALTGFPIGGERLPGVGGAAFGAVFGVGAIVFLPICYGIVGFIGGWIVASLYNWVAGRFGGIVVETQ